jgi:predicted permease
LLLRDLLRPARADAELDAELRFHVERRTEELVARGLPEAEARVQARRELGGIEQVKEECRELRALRWLDSAAADLRYAWRALRRTPGFTAVAAASLAIGIGASTAIFSVADAAWLRPLPVEEAERLVELEATFPDGHWRTNLDRAVFAELHDQPQPFLDLFATAENSLRLRLGRGTSEETRVLFVSGGYFPVLGTRPALGRLLRDDDDRPGAARVAVLSHSFWTRRLGARPDVVGQPMWLGGYGPRAMFDGFPVTVVGVAPPAFVGVDRSFRPELFLPLSAQPPTTMLWIAGRLRPGVSMASAEARLAPLYARGVQSMRDQIRGWPAHEQRDFLAQRVRLLPAGNGTARLRWQLAEPLPVLIGAVLLVLAISSTNVAALQLSRGERRLPEVSLRLSLGAGRGRVVRQLLTESILLALVGGAAGLALGVALHRLLLALSPLDRSAVLDFRFDWHLFGLTAGLCALAGMATGWLPALRLSRADPYPVLKGNRGACARWRSGPRRAILVAQVATTFVLLAGAGLLLRSLVRLSHADTGFDRRNLLLVRVDAAASRFRDRPAIEWGGLVRERVAALPGVRSAALAAKDVFAGGWVMDVWVEGYAYRRGERQMVDFSEVGPGFFATAGVPLVGGREFLPGDGPGAPNVAIVNRAFVRKYLGDEAEAIGRRFRDGRQWHEIVGVVADAKLGSLHDPPPPAVYCALGQQMQRLSYPLALHVRADAPAAALAPAIRRAIADVDPDLEIRRLETLDESIATTLRRERMFTALLSLFAAVTLLLTAVGLYGTMAYAAARRTAEIGIRRALGAGEARVVAWMLKETAAVIVIGAAVGLPGAALALRTVRTLLFQVAPLDPVSFGLALAAVLAVGLGAAAVPALSAARLPPTTALRYE